MISSNLAEASQTDGESNKLSVRDIVVLILGIILPVFTIAEVNYPQLQPQTSLSIFAMLGLTICFLTVPLSPRFKFARWSQAVDWVLVGMTLFSCGFVAIQTEPVFSAVWLGGTSLGNRAAAETPVDYFVGILGLIVVLEATRRSIGIALPLLAMLFVAYALFGRDMPSWMFPHKGYSVGRIVSQTFLHSQGVFGTALSVMFTFVLLFVVFGSFLESSGATAFIIHFAKRLFGRTAGGPAKVAVASSALMGTLSGSAVANAVTTGTFTIPMMRSAGFPPYIAAAVEAVASSGGALVPPVMGAAAYMMLEIINPPVTYLQICRAALIPAVLYYLALFLIVHFYAKKLVWEGKHTVPVGVDPPPEQTAAEISPFSGVVFFGSLAVLVYFLVTGNSAFLAATKAMVVLWVLALLHPATRLNPKKTIMTLVDSSKNGVALIAASACVGIIIGVVTLTGIGTKVPAAVIPFAQGNLPVALIIIMLSTIVLGMGLPSVVCYLLVAVLFAPVIGEMGNIEPLAVHLFIFYYAMMSMVTPPVALAAYATASIANASIMKTGLRAFQFALTGFTLPFLFIFRPALLLMGSPGEEFSIAAGISAIGVALVGVVMLSAVVVGYLFGPLNWAMRVGFAIACVLSLFPDESFTILGFPTSLSDICGLSIGAVLLLIHLGVGRNNKPTSAPATAV